MLIRVYNSMSITHEKFARPIMFMSWVCFPLAQAGAFHCFLSPSASQAEVEVVAS